MVAPTTRPFQSVDRQEFVEAGRLQQGERVQLYGGETKRVVQKLPRPGPVNVYNLEVYVERVYSVTPDGALAHNSCPQKNYVYVAIKNKDSFITQDTFKRLMKGELNDESLYVEYVGIANNVKRRSSEHGKTRIIHELVFDGNCTLTRDQARALEQLLINRYGKNGKNKKNGKNYQI